MLNVYGSLLIFITCFIIFAYGRIHRTVAAMLGATAMLIFGTSRGFYTQEMAVNAIDFNTIGLLFGMMIIVAVLRQTGFFRYLAIKGVKLAKGDPWKLLVALGFITAFVSMIIDNVTTVLLISPMTLLISDILGISPVPILIGEVILSNVGGVATMVGDPPNIMIGSASGFTFNSFIMHLMPISLLASGVSLIALKIIFASQLQKRKDKIRQILHMREKEAIRDKISLLKCLLILAFVVALFATEEIHGIKPALDAILGAALTLIIVRPKVKEVFSRVEWSILLFFGALFVMVGGVDKAGTLKIFGSKLQYVSSNLLSLSLIFLWVSFVLSAFVDNIPYTAAMIPVIKHLKISGLDIEPLWWALAIGAGFGGNGTPVGSSAGVIVMGLSEKTKFPFTFKDWIRSAGVISLLTGAVATLVFIVCFSWFC